MFSRLKTLTAAGFAATLVCAPATSLGAITIVDVQGDSNSIDLDGTAPTIFGGVAGDNSVGTCATGKDGTNTCSSCYDTGNSVGDGRLLACNPTRIYDSLRLQIVISSDTVDGGRPLITTSDDSAPLTAAETTQVTAKGEQGVFVVTWNTICDALDTDNDFAGCELIDSGDKREASFKIGMDKGANGKLGDSDDDSKTITIKIHKGFYTAAGDVSTMEHVDCGPIPPLDFMGVCKFDVNPGDEKVQIRDVQAAANFPQSEGISFTDVLFFHSTTGFADISSASPYVALPVESEDTATFALTSDRVTGLENEILYYFKAAVQDQAGNIGFFTSNSASKTCASTNYEPPCHTAVPGEVTGVLADNVNCFIATAAWGSPMSKQVGLFRSFRDEKLLPYKWGRSFVRLYYKFGPTAAKAIARSETLRAVSRAALAPLLAYAWLSLRIGALAALAVFALTLSTPAFVLIYQRRRARAAPGRREQQRLDT